VGVPSATPKGGWAEGLIVAPKSSICKAAAAAEFSKAAAASLSHPGSRTASFKHGTRRARSPRTLAWSNVTAASSKPPPVCAGTMLFEKAANECNLRLSTWSTTTAAAVSAAAPATPKSSISNAAAASLSHRGSSPCTASFTHATEGPRRKERCAEGRVSGRGAAVFTSVAGGVISASG